jgi:signal peptidase I
MYINDNEDRIKTPIPIRLGIFAAGLVLGFFVLRIFVTPYIVTDESMRPNYKKGDFVLILKHFTPAKGRVIIATVPEGGDTVTLKRVVASEGDKVEIVDKTLLINGIKANFSWKTVSTDPRVYPAAFSHRDSMDQMIVGKDQFFILGDNLDFSFDSREFGSIRGNRIVGFVLFKL